MKKTKQLKETIGTVISASKQWWLKINTKSFRKHPLDGALFPYIIKVSYIVDNVAYVKRKWVNAGADIPDIESQVKVLYNIQNPKKAKIIL